MTKLGELGIGTLSESVTQTDVELTALDVRLQIKYFAYLHPF